MKRGQSRGPLIVFIVMIAVGIGAFLIYQGMGPPTGNVVKDNKQENCRDVQVPYTEQESYNEYEYYQEPIKNTEQKSQVVYDSTLQSSSSGGKLFAFFKIKPASIIRGSITTSKRSYFGISTPEECDNILHDRPYMPGYIVQNNVLYSNIDADTSNWEGNPINLCIHIWDSNWQDSSLNSAQIKLTNYWNEDTISYETKQRPITKYRTVTKYRTEQRCD